MFRKILRRIGNLSLCLIIIVIVLEGVTLYFLMQGKKEKKSHSNKKILKKWELLADNALAKKQFYQAIYFFEKVLRELPEEHPGRLDISKKLSSIYDGLNSKKKLDPPRTFDNNTIIKNNIYVSNVNSNQRAFASLYKIANQSYQNKNYLRALNLFYIFLAQIDENNSLKKWYPRVRFKINQCLLSHFMQTFVENDEDKFKEPVISAILENIRE